MPQRSLPRISISRLNRLKIPYVITVAVESVIYGESRLTNDLDLVLLMKTDDVERFIQAFPPTEFYRPPREVLRIEIGRPHRGHFNLIHHLTGSKDQAVLQRAQIEKRIQPP